MMSLGSGLALASIGRCDLVRLVRSDTDRFSRCFRAAVRKLRRRGKVSLEDSKKFIQFSRYQEPIKAAGSFGTPSFVLMKECEKLARASGGFLDTLADWWSNLVQWIMDNWETVLKILLTLIVLI